MKIHITIISSNLKNLVMLNKLKMLRCIKAFSYDVRLWCMNYVIHDFSGTSYNFMENVACHIIDYKNHKRHCRNDDNVSP